MNILSEIRVVASTTLIAGLCATSAVWAQTQPATASSDAPILIDFSEGDEPAVRDSYLLAEPEDAATTPATENTETPLHIENPASEEPGTEEDAGPPRDARSERIIKTQINAERFAAVAKKQLAEGDSIIAVSPDEVFVSGSLENIARIEELAGKLKSSHEKSLTRTLRLAVFAAGLARPTARLLDEAQLQQVLDRFDLEEGDVAEMNLPDDLEILSDAVLAISSGEESRFAVADDLEATLKLRDEEGQSKLEFGISRNGTRLADGHETASRLLLHDNFLIERQKPVILGITSSGQTLFAVLLLQ